MNERETQKKIILEHLTAGEKLTPADAFRLTGSTRLSARIYDLRCDGYVINTEMITVRNRFGRTDDPVYWQHIDKLLIDTLKMEWDAENYEEMGE